MHAFWDVVASNSLVVLVLAAGVALLGRVWKNPAALHLLWVLVLAKLVAPPVVTVPVRMVASLRDAQISVSVFLARRIKMFENRACAVRLTAGRLVLLAAVAALPMAVAFAVEPPKDGAKAAQARQGDSAVAQVSQESGKSQPAAAKPAVSGTSAQEKEIAEWRRETWQMVIGLDAPDLVPPAVQWAVVDKDPLPDFRARVKMMHAYYRSRQESRESEAEKQQQRFAQMGVSWDLGFRSVTADQLYLLTSGHSLSSDPIRYLYEALSLTSAGGSCLSSNGPDGKKWVVTKVVHLKRKPVCWCLPVEVKRGQEIKVTLSERNAFDLESAFEAAMREAQADAKAPGEGPQVVQRVNSRMSIGFSSPEGAKHFDEVKQLIAQKKYQFVKTFEMPPGKTQYVYRFTCADGFQTNMNFSVPLDNVASWDDYLQKSGQQDTPR